MNAALTLPSLCGQLIEVFPVNGRIFMVLEKATTDLDKLIRQRCAVSM